MMKTMSVEIPREYKAKIALVDENGDIMTLIRSHDDDNRPGGHDWPGGTVKDEGHEDETIEEGMFREVEVEEMPGTRLLRDTVTLIYAKTKIKDGTLVTSHLYAGVAVYPQEGIVLSTEHISAGPKPRAEYPLKDMPGKYETGLILGEQVIDHFMELQRTGELEPRAVLLDQAAA